MYKEKSHTCEEGRAYLRISAWHLLMNLKNNYLLKNHTQGRVHVRISVWHLLMNLKKLFIKKLLKWANKECENFNIYNVVFFKKKQRKHLELSLFYTCVPKILMI